MKPTSQRGLREQFGERAQRSPQRERGRSRPRRVARSSRGSARPSTRAQAQARLRASATPSAQRQVGLGRQCSDADTRQVAAVLVDDEPPFPGGKNLRLKSRRLSSWKWPFSASSARRCTPCSGVRSAPGESSCANGEKLSDTRAIPVSRRPRDALADQPLVEAVRDRPEPRHRRQRERPPGACDREVQEARPAGPPGRGRPRTAPRRRRARSSASSAITKPRSGSSPRHARRSPRARRAAPRRARPDARPPPRSLPPAAGGPTAEPCGSAGLRARTPCVDDRLVAVVERVEPVLAVELEPRLGGAEHGDPPSPSAGVDDERGDQRGQLVVGPIGSPETIATPCTTR